jgi:hypothetical protein
LRITAVFIFKVTNLGLKSCILIHLTMTEDIVTFVMN